MNDFFFRFYDPELKFGCDISKSTVEFYNLKKVGAQRDFHLKRGTPNKVFFI